MKTAMGNGVAPTVSPAAARTDASGRRVTITLPIACYGYWDVVRAEIVDPAPHLANVASFALHRGIGWAKWEVSNIETGMSVKRDDNKEMAVIAAMEKLSGQTPSSMAQAMRRGCFSSQVAAFACQNDFHFRGYPFSSAYF